MKNVLNVLKGKAGFVSIETIIVAGLMIGLGVYAITNFYAAGQTTADSAVDKLNSVLDIAVS